MRLRGYRITRYVADTLVVEGESETIVLRGEAFVDRDGTKLQADSIAYGQSSCRLDASGLPSCSIARPSSWATGCATTRACAAV
jgi:lipopolysaccharide export system protein LptA